MRCFKVLAAAAALTLGLLPLAAGEGQKVTGQEAAEIRAAIADYIRQDAELKGGFFLYDPELKRVVSFDFDHVHDGVSRTDDGQYFACADLRSARGVLYDVDVYVKKTEQGLRPAKLVIHKVDGQKRE